MFNLPLLTFKLLIVSYLTTKRQMVHNRTAQRNSWNQNYDFIIVGAGTAGCVVANRLTENSNVNVLLLEEGGPQDAIYTDIPGLYTMLQYVRPDVERTYMTEPVDNLGQNSPDRRLFDNMGRIIGGSSSHNAMQYWRGHPRGYDNWVTTYGAKGWSFREVLPFFKKFENNTDLNIVINNPGYHATNGPVQITTPRYLDPILSIVKQNVMKLGFAETDINGANQTGVRVLQNYVTTNRLRSAAANAYVDPNPHPSNLHIVTNAMVLRVLFDGNTAIGVEFDRNDASYRVYARKEVILSSGPYQTPQLLMLSGVGPRDNLRSFGIPVLIDLPVGHNYQTMPHINMAFTINSSLLLDTAISLDNLDQFYFRHSGPLSQYANLFTYFSTKYNSDKNWPNAFLAVYPLFGTIIFQTNLIRINYRGTIQLQSSSPYIQPKIYSNVLGGQGDFENHMQAFRFVLNLIEGTPIGQYLSSLTSIFQSSGCPICEGRPFAQCKSAIICFITKNIAIEHPGGSCRMGSIDRDDVVVDPFLRVKHANNLRVCDSSIFPEIPNTGPEAATLMVGEKCAQIIKDFYK